MLVEYLGLIGLLAVGLGMAFFLYTLASGLRKRRARAAGLDGSVLDSVSEEPGIPVGRSTARYFFIAIVGLMLHAGSFYFYLWGATIRKAGLTGLMVMLGFGMCLMMGVFYAWARGAVSYATESEDEARVDSAKPSA